MNPTGNVFVVTGASSGIGEELARVLARKGAHVVCAARRQDQLERVCRSIRSSGGSALAVQTDITQSDQVQNLVKSTIDQFGRIDCLVLNAGISMWARFDEISDPEFFMDLIATNYLGAVRCVHAAFPYLKESHGKIVSSSTAQALMGFPWHSGYSASKHALHGFLETLAIENRGDFTVLEAVLGWIRDTNLRRNAFGPTGRRYSHPVRRHSRRSMDLEECVGKIVRAIERDKSTVYIPAKLGLVPIMNALFKPILHSRISRAADKEDQ